MKKLITSLMMLASMTVFFEAKAAPIVDPPQDFYVCPGSTTTAVFSATPNYSGVTGFQWQSYNYSTATWENVVNSLKFGISGATTSTLSIDNKFGWTYVAGKEPLYKCRYVYNSTTYYTGSVYIKVSTTVAFTTQTSYSPSGSMCSGSSQKAYVRATGASLTYQWYSGVTGYIPLIGATSNEYSYTATYPTTSGWKLYCKITNSCGSASLNSTATLAPVALEVPVISGQPAATKSACEGANVTIPLSATSSGTLNYTWMKNGSTLVGQTTNTCTLNSVTTANSGNYNCRVGHSLNSCTVTSTVCTLTVNQAVAITQHPLDQEVGSGSTVSFVVAGTGNITGYQWQQENVLNSGTFSNISDTGIVSGATLAKLTLTNVKVTRRYRCVISSSCAPTSQNSNITKLTVTTAPAYTAHPVNTTACVGSNANFSVTVLNATSYEWEYSSNGTTWTPIASSNSTSLSYNVPSPSFDGYYFHCKATGSGITVTSDAAILTVKTPVSITLQPIAQSKCKYDSAGLVVTATGSDLSYLWYQNGSATTETNDTISVPELYLSYDGNYYCKVSNFCGSVNSSTVLFKVSDVPHPTDLGNDTTICWKQKVTLDPGAFTSYLWNTGAISRTVNADSNITYSVTVTDANNCKTTVSRGLNIRKPWDSTQICMVTYDDAKGKNKVIWDRTLNKRIVSYNIYKIVGGNYELLGNVKIDSLSVFVDKLSSPTIKNDQYAIRAIDSCGNESNRSKYVSTMLLTASKGTLNTEANLVWTKYVDESGAFVPSYYYIWKGKTKDAMTLLDSVSGLLAPMYIDQKFDGKSAIYKIEIRKPSACAPAILKAESGPYSQSLSNIAEYKVVGLEQVNEIPVSVYQNPFNESLNIVYTLDQSCDVAIEITDAGGKKVYESIRKNQTAGENTVVINAAAANIGTGIYNVKIISGGKISVIKCIGEK